MTTGMTTHLWRNAPSDVICPACNGAGGIVETAIRNIRTGGVTRQQPECRNCGYGFDDAEHDPEDARVLQQIAKGEHWHKVTEDCRCETPQPAGPERNHDDDDATQ